MSARLRSSSSGSAPPTAWPDVERFLDAQKRLVLETSRLAALANAVLAYARNIDNLGALAGAVMSDAFPPMPITSVKVAGAKITLTITAPDGSEATINMELKGDDVTGDWSMPNDGSKIVGKKLP